MEDNNKFSIFNFKFSKLLKVWVRISLLAGQSQLLTNWSGFLFILGKLVRFAFFFIFLLTVLSGAKTLAGYSREQVIFFFLIFNLIEIIAQFLFRGVYLFRSSVVQGNFDLDLLKPWPSYFRPIFGWTDILDFLTLIPLIIYVIYFVTAYQLSAGVLSWFLFLLLLVCSLLISFAFHLVVCAVCVLTMEIDHLVWIYRDLTNMARVPTDIYPKAIQFLLTFTIPVILLMTVPAKALLGVLSWPWIAGSLTAGVFLLWLSLCFWRYALKNYTSASS